MANKKVTREFPECEPRGIQEEEFRLRLKHMVDDYLSFMSVQEPKRRPRTFVKPYNGELVWTEVQFPDYPPWLEDGERSDAIKLKGVADLFDYVWERGEMRRSYTGPNPTRTTWQTNLLQTILHIPLMNLLAFSALLQAVRSGVVADPWVIAPDIRDRFLEELTKRHCRGLHAYIARCPLAWFRVPSGTSIDFGSGMVLRNYTLAEKALYLSQTKNQILWHDSISQLNHENIAVLELTGEIESEVVQRGKPPRTGDDLVKENIANTLDVLKWAIVTATTQTITPIEGTIIYSGLFGDQLGISPIGSFRREDKSGGILFELDEETNMSIKNLVRLALAWREKSEDVRQAYWHWGRAAITDLHRDRLLESVIGLERLLVQHSGESRYRFGLHGAALLATSKDDIFNKAKELREIYSQRSSAAHGSVKEPHAYSGSSHKSLGDVIHDILELYESKYFEPNSRVAEQVEKHVLRNALLNNGDV